MIHNPSGKHSPTESTTAVIRRGALYNLAGYIGKIGKPIAHFLVPVFYGYEVAANYFLALALYEITLQFSQIGLNRGLLVRIPAYQQETSPVLVPRAIWTAVLTAGCLGLATLALVWGLFSQWINPVAWPYYKWIMLSVPVVAMTNVLTHATMAQKTMKYQVWIKKIGDPIFTLTIMAAIGLSGLPPENVVFAIFGAGLITLVLAIWAVGRLYNLRAILRVALERRYDRDLVLFSIPLGLGDFFNILLFRADIIILNYFGIPLVHIGMYAIAARLVTVFREIRKLFDPLIMPIFSEQYQKKNLELIEGLIHRLTLWVWALIAPIVIFLLVFAEELRNLFEKFGAADAPAAIPGQTFDFRVVLCTLMIGLLFRSIAFLSFASVISAGYSRLDLWNNLRGFVLVTALMALLVPVWGVNGAAVALTLTVIVVSGFHWDQVRKYVGIQPFSRKVLRVLGMSALIIGSLAVVIFVWDLGPRLDIRIGLFFSAVILLYGLFWRIVGREILHIPQDAELAEKIRRKKKGGALPQSRPWTPPPGLARSPDAPHILLIIVDCLRGDRIVGADRTCVTPHIDAFREAGVTFERNFSTAVHTTPSVTSILTGEYPMRHGISSIHGALHGQHIPMLQEVLKAAGYRTAAFVTGPLERARGLTRGFDEYHYRSRRDALLAHGFADDFQTALRRIHAGGRAPALVVLHLWEMHQHWHWIAPVGTQPAFRGSEWGATAYDRAVSSLDADLGKILDHLPDNTFTIITGDHGDNITTNQRYVRARIKKFFGGRVTPREFHRSHGFHVYNSLIHVPLVMHWPGGLPAGQRIDRKVHSIDVTPTILDYCGLGDAVPTTGRSLRPLVAGADFPDVPLYLEAQSHRTARRDWRKGVYLDPWKYSATTDAPDLHEELYRTDEDPQELSNLAAQHPEILARMRGLLRDLQNEAPPSRA